jgi:phosphoribosylamine---glycine ligase
MRVLGVGSSCDLGALYLRLIAAGHEVRVFIADFAQSGVMDGLLARVDDWHAQLSWVHAAGSDGVIVFETADFGAEQDGLRRDGFQVIGGCSEGDRLENDRQYAQDVLADVGLQSPPTRTFSDFERAIAYIEARPARYVFKLNGSETSSWRNYVGQAPDGRDVIALLRGQRARLAAAGAHDVSFVLSEHVSGVEVGTGAYFNGQRFLEPACLDFEHKRFFPGDLGELTGEMGTVVSYRNAERLFSRSLALLAPRLRASGYVGYVNLNTIVNERGIWPLELTCRFGYPGFAILDALQLESWDQLFAKMLDPASTSFATAPGYAVGVVLTVPPFPYRYGYAEVSKGLPILLDPMLSERERERLYFGEVARAGDQLVASGTTGYLMVATGTGSDAEDAGREAYALAGRVYVPNLRYRNDIGASFVSRDRATLQRLGYLPIPREGA